MTFDINSDDNNVFECHIFQAINDIRKQNRRPGVNAIFKNITSANATNITVEDVKQKVNLLIASAKLKSMPTSQGSDSFYIIANSTTLQAGFDNIDPEITEQLSSQISSPLETKRNQQVKDRFDNFAVKVYFRNEI